jgi:penicillin-binding protein 1A
LGRRERKKQKTKHLNIRRIRNIFLGLIFVSLIVGTGIFAGMYAAISSEIKAMNVQSLALNYSSFLYYNDENGNSQLIQQLYNDTNRIWIDSDKIPDQMKKATVAIEDERFFKHHGVDVKRTAGAAINWALNKVGIKRSSYGGSTITQQVIKNITKEDEKSVTRKIREMMRAIALEKELSKDDILTMYLNIVYFANNCHGVEAASNMYFNKSANELSLAQTASIVGITQTPARYDPFAHPDNNVEKRNRVLAKMLELEMISQSEYDSAVAEKLVTSKEHKEAKANISSYFVDQVINDVISDLQTKKGYSDTFAEQQVFNGGLKIYTTMDKNIQDAMENVFTNTSNFPKNNAQSAMVIIDPHNGEIKGIIGGLGKKTDRRGLNRATQSKRQPGSSIKPIAVYAPAIENAKLSAASIIKDEPLTIGSWSPKNSYSGYKGDMTTGKAIEISANIPAVKTLDKVGVDTSYNFLKNKLHITSLDPKDKNLSSLGLGGLTTGISPKEMAAAYGVFANNGKYIAPYTYTKVVDSAGKVLLENQPNEQTAIEPSTAYIMANMLHHVVNGGSGTGRSARLSKMPAYGKTGTTNDDYDKWFIGFTPYYVGAVWYGFDTPKSISKSGVSYNPATRAWKSVMEKVHSGLPVKQLDKPSSVVSAEVCAATGKLASQSCESYTEYFTKNTVPKSVCSGSHSGGRIAPEDNQENDNPDASASPSASPSSAPDDAENNPQKTPVPQKTPAPTREPSPTRDPQSQPSGGDDVIDLDD